MYASLKIRQKYLRKRCVMPARLGDADDNNVLQIFINVRKIMALRVESVILIYRSALP